MQQTRDTHQSTHLERNNSPQTRDTHQSTHLDNCCQLIDTWIFPISSLCPFLHLSEPQTGEHQLRI
jgi:hypothetical protein